MPDVIGEQIDRLITVELKSRGMSHDIVRWLYDAMRHEVGVAALLEVRAPGHAPARLVMREVETAKAASCAVLRVAREKR